MTVSFQALLSTHDFCYRIRSYAYTGVEIRVAWPLLEILAPVGPARDARAQSALHGMSALFLPHPDRPQPTSTRVPRH